MNLKWYAHGSYSSEGQNEEELIRVLPEPLTEEASKTLAQELYNFFYEVEFDLEFNEKTGKLTKVSLAPNQRYSVEQSR